MHKAVLDLKTDERVIEPFRRIWPNENGELTTAFDAVHIGPPPELTKLKHFFNKSAFHTDQASNKEGLCCVQVFSKFQIIRPRC